jgi:hypothetical protein
MFLRTTPIIIFFHCVFRIDGNRLPAARPIVKEQMSVLKRSGLQYVASEIHIGVNGKKDNLSDYVGLFPRGSKVVFHGDNCRTELRTLLMIEEWCYDHKGEANILYFHSKGATHVPGSIHEVTISTPWRNCMMHTCVEKWRFCVKDLESHEAVGCHWRSLRLPGSSEIQSYFAGTFWWCRASFFRTIPSFTTRERIKISGIDSIDSRYESEVHLGNGPRLPNVKNYYPESIDCFYCARELVIMRKR